MNGSVKETLALMALLLFLCGGMIIVRAIFDSKAALIFAGSVLVIYSACCLAAWYELNK